MKICIVGGGPAGLYFAILMKRLDASHDIVIFERDGPDDTFGWGIVFSDQTFGYLESSDAPSFTRIIETCQTWNNVDIVHRGEKVTIRGNRFSGIARLAFLNILHRRCHELGVDIRFRTNITNRAQLPEHDLFVGADGANSVTRQWFSDVLAPSVDQRKNKYLWLGTPQLFHGLTLTFHQTDKGTFVAHAYKFSENMSTFIVECGEETWARAGLEGKSDDETCAYLQDIFAVTDSNGVTYSLANLEGGNVSVGHAGTGIFQNSNSANTSTFTSENAKLGFIASLDTIAVSMFTLAIEDLADSRAENGGEMSRLMMVNELLVQNQTNLEAAHGRIMDADIALESTRFARQNVLVQSSAAMVAQANQLTNIALAVLG